VIVAPKLLIFPADVLSIDTSDIENLRIVVHTQSHGEVEVLGLQALEAVREYKPSALENRRLRWIKHSWSVHNIVGHPLMQVLAWFRLYKLAIRVHDVTVPKPRGKKLTQPRDSY
jgi:hypothetical protein